MIWRGGVTERMASCLCICELNYNSDYPNRILAKLAHRIGNKDDTDLADFHRYIFYIRIISARSASSAFLLEDPASNKDRCVTLGSTLFQIVSVRTCYLY